MPEPELPPNPYERIPQLNPTLLQAAEFVRLIFGRAGIRVTRFVLAVEIEHKDLDKPFRTAASWPLNEMDEAADLAGEAKTIFRMAHTSQQTKGQG